MVISSFSFEGSKRTFALPDEIMINPADILDNKDHVYRVSLGRADYTEHEASMCKMLFDILDRELTKGSFINTVKIKSCGKQLTFDMAFVTRTENKYGRFYDLEAVADGLCYGDAPVDKIKRENKA